MALDVAAGWLVDGIGVGFSIVLVVGTPLFMFFLALSARRRGA